MDKANEKEQKRWAVCSNKGWKGKSLFVTLQTGEVWGPAGCTWRRGVGVTLGQHRAHTARNSQVLQLAGGSDLAGKNLFPTGQQACGEHYSADQQENCQWKEKLSFSQQEKQKICELLMETDGDVGQEVERAQLGKHPQARRHHRGWRGQCALQNWPRPFLWETQHLPMLHIWLPFFDSAFISSHSLPS